MPCDACARMLESETPTAHAWLAEAHSPTRLRRLGRPAVVVRLFRCSQCYTNWLAEIDPLQPDNVDWLCLHSASNVLAPVSMLNPGLERGSQTPPVEATRRTDPTLISVPGVPANGVIRKHRNPGVQNRRFRYPFDMFQWRKRY